jgi:hypothetical protein
VWTRPLPAVGGSLPIIPPQTSSRKDAARCPEGVRACHRHARSLLVLAAGVPKVLPDASARRLVRTGFMLMSAGIVLLVAQRRDARLSRERSRARHGGERSVEMHAKGAVSVGPRVRAGRQCPVACQRGCRRVDVHGRARRRLRCGGARVRGRSATGLGSTNASPQFEPVGDGHVLAVRPAPAQTPPPASPPPPGSPHIYPGSSTWSRSTRSPPNGLPSWTPVCRSRSTTRSGSWCPSRRSCCWW